MVAVWLNWPSFLQFDDHWKGTKGVQRMGMFPPDPTLQQVLNLASDRPAARLE